MPRKNPAATPAPASPDANNPHQLLTELEAAHILQLAPATLASWRNMKTGPRYMRINQRIIRYRRSDLIRWTESMFVEPTST
jgi:predicted DNA-binding transcriptional regulator AlpA